MEVGQKDLNLHILCLDSFWKLLHIVHALLLANVLSAGISEANNLTSDRLVLLSFKSSADSLQKLSSWGRGSPCSGRWHGVTCLNGRVAHLVLERLELKGSISALVQLDELRVLSLDGNTLIGPLPDLTSWRYLTSLYLSNNQFTGPIPESVSFLSRLWRLDLSDNLLNGSIPSSLNLLSKLLTLKLQDNKFTGHLPNLNLPNLKELNVSGNQLTGPIPPLLSNFSISSFQGNTDLCGVPLFVCGSSNTSNSGISKDPMIVASSPSSKPPLSDNKKKAPVKLGTGALIAIVVGDVAVVVLITFFVILYYCRKYSQSDVPTGKKLKMDSEKIVFNAVNYPLQSEPERGKLVFIDGRKQFELEDLLRASAEMLGKGTFGTAYKAVLEDGSVVAVKRLKDLSAMGRKEFEQHMEIIGRFRHPNLVALRAYYYARDEKLLVYDYLPSGNLYTLLHGNRGPGRTPLDWMTRVKIALETAKGLAFIHHQCKPQKLPHGNIKSSNILLDKNGNAYISDFGLALMANSSVVVSRLVGYRPPEYSEAKRISQKADVYSFGVLLLEILTGKAPAHSYPYDEFVDLPKWVQSVVQEEWTAEVFDLELLRYKNSEEEMVAMLQIAMACVSQAPQQRPRMSQVVKMIEDVIGEQQSPQRDDSFDSTSMSPSVSEEAVASR
ncbi:hypothetical protein KP509_03G086300 [Ceratopteris richardii]|uniref:Protein kinase domain-containing protein n=1 Tax=Ceratopteris richardii TaxID=49495 RepID=A0A8T2V5A1_CERRI|nr:hypothetical protein KP509_03G086300 [Ceratopteris richardii]KAH7442391.1 hypothetical protein KP509_03G086300 [Ceratopteris richardii]